MTKPEARRRLVTQALYLRSAGMAAAEFEKALEVDDDLVILDTQAYPAAALLDSVEVSHLIQLIWGGFFDPTY